MTRSTLDEMYYDPMTARPNRLDGRPAQILEHSGPDSNPIEKIVHEIVHLTPM